MCCSVWPCVAARFAGIPLIGDKVVYFSESHMRWILTIITDVGDADEVELEIKPGAPRQQHPPPTARGVVSMGSLFVLLECRSRKAGTLNPIRVTTLNHKP